MTRYRALPAEKMVKSNSAAAAMSRRRRRVEGKAIKRAIVRSAVGMEAMKFLTSPLLARVPGLTHGFGQRVAVRQVER